MKTTSYEEFGELLKAMGHPVRLRILKGLLEDECNVSGIQKAIGVPQSTISQHLRVLKDRGIIRARKEGRRRCYHVVDARAKAILTTM